MAISLMGWVRWSAGSAISIQVRSNSMKTGGTRYKSNMIVKLTQG